MTQNALAEGVLDQWREQIVHTGFSFQNAQNIAALRPQLLANPDWQVFSESYDRLAIDQYMGDQGRYRRRRYAVYRLDESGISSSEHQPHYQSTLYNRLNGGVERWFEPIESNTSVRSALRGWLKVCFELFAPLRPDIKSWHCEVHQFRIEAKASELGKPTPEGLHRDGVDFVLVALVQRQRVQAGTTTLHLPDRSCVARFTLEQPGDCVFLDDNRLLHGVTPVLPSDPDLLGFRDVLVVTLRGLPPTPKSTGIPKRDDPDAD